MAEADGLYGYKSDEPFWEWMNRQAVVRYAREELGHKDSWAHLGAYEARCYAMLYYAMLWYAMLCYAILYYTILCDAMLLYVTLCYAILSFEIAEQLILAATNNTDRLSVRTHAANEPEWLIFLDHGAHENCRVVAYECVLMEGFVWPTMDAA